MTDKADKNADIFAVAKAARVSISTVSRSFNHPDLVKPATRKKIDTAVRKLGYIRNRAAQTMHGIRSGTIGLVVPTIDHAIFAEVIQAFSEAVGEQGFTILLSSHGYDLEKEYAILRKFLEHRVDGVGVIGLDHSEETFLLFERHDIPAISIWNYAKNARIACVGADNAAAGRLAARHLIDLGHTRVATLYPPIDGNDRARDRIRAADATLSDYGITIPDFWRAEAAYSLSAAKDAVARLLCQPEQPSALLCGNDVLATGALYASQEHGVNVPGDMSIIGIGDFKGSADMVPGLSTIRLPAQRIGRLAGETLSGAIINSKRPTDRIECEIELRARATCARL